MPRNNLSAPKLLLISLIEAPVPTGPSALTLAHWIRSIETLHLWRSTYIPSTQTSLAGAVLLGHPYSSLTGEPPDLITYIRPHRSRFPQSSEKELSSTCRLSSSHSILVSGFHFVSTNNHETIFEQSLPSDHDVKGYDFPFCFELSCKTLSTLSELGLCINGTLK